MVTLTHEGLFMLGAIWFGLGFGLGGLWMLVKCRNAAGDKAAAKQREHDRGWGYAAGRLLREGRACIVDLEVHVEMARMSAMDDEFDNGIKAAIFEWERQHEKKV